MAAASEGAKQHPRETASGAEIENVKERDTSHLFNFTGITANKAGMGADRAMVAKYVYEKSRNSKYTQRQEDLDAKQQARAEAMATELRAQDARMTEAEHQEEQRRTALVMEALEAKRDLSRTHCVVDMDMFYAAVEIRDNPELEHKPVAIGGLGMISTSNYVARLYGVRAAMPGFIAQEMVREPHLVGSKMPPDELIFVRPDFTKYTQAATVAREIFREYDPDFTSWSLDEAYMDLTAYLSTRGGPDAADEVVRELRARVKERTGGLTCSAGIGPNPMLAKVCSDDNKPDGQSRIKPTKEAVLDYLHQLPTRKVTGIGKVLEKQLKVVLGVVTCGDLLSSATALRRAFANRPKSVDFLLRVSLGLSGGEVVDDDGEVIGDVARKSLSTERTFSREADTAELQARLKELCQAVAEEMASHVPPLAGKAVTLKTKTSSFEVRTKERRFGRYIGFNPSFASKSKSDAVEQTADECAAEVSRVCDELYAITLPILEEQFPCELRLMGVRVASFRGARSTLQRGQQCLGRFFAQETVNKPQATFESPAKATDGDTSAAERARPADATCEAADEAVMLIDESGDEADEVAPADAASNTVRCPVCSALVCVEDADRHVNAHYDTPVPSAKMPLTSNMSPVPTKSDSRGRKRKAERVLGEQHPVKMALSFAPKRSRGSARLAAMA